jgi:hypothetical protein
VFSFRVGQQRLAGVTSTDPQAIAAANARLARLMAVSQEYVSAFVVSAKGRLVLTAKAAPTIADYDFSGAEQFGKAMAVQDPDAWFTDAVWQNPFSGGRAVLVFVKAVRVSPAERPVGVLYLEFDWQKLMDEVLSEGIGGRGITGTIVDPEGRRVGSSNGAPFGAPVQLPAGHGSGVERRAHSVAAFATARPLGSFSGLGFRCVIEQPMPSEEEIAEAIGRRCEKRAA